MRASKRHRAIALFMAASFTFAMVPTLAFAGPPPVPPVKVVGGKKVVEPPKPKTVAERLPEDARKHFESGLLLYEDKNFEGAMVEFKTAYDTSKEARVLQNVAICQKNLKHYAAAIGTLQRELTEAADLEPEKKKELQDEIDILMPLTSTVAITASEPGAQVYVDGELVGPTPVAEFRVDVGERTFTAKLPGFVDSSQKVVISGSTAAKVTLAMEPTVKLAHVRVVAAGLPKDVVARVTIDGTEMGATPWEGDLLAGKHTIDVTAPGYVAQKTTREFAYKEKSDIELKLEKEKHEGLLVIDTIDPTAKISIDGKIVGTGSFKGAVTSGGHQISVSDDGYKPWKSEVTVLDNQTRSMSVDLEKERSTWYWWVGGAVALAGAGVGAYFLFKPKTEEPVSGTMQPGVLSLPLGR